VNGQIRLGGYVHLTVCRGVSKDLISRVVPIKQIQLGSIVAVILLQRQDCLVELCIESFVDCIVCRQASLGILRAILRQNGLECWKATLWRDIRQEYESRPTIMKPLHLKSGNNSMSELNTSSHTYRN
jgi:hypothetical protein